MYSMAIAVQGSTASSFRLVAVLTVALVTTERRFAFGHAAIYLAACAPAALYVASSGPGS